MTISITLNRIEFHLNECIAYLDKMAINSIDNYRTHLNLLWNWGQELYLETKSPYFDKDVPSCYNREDLMIFAEDLAKINGCTLKEVPEVLSYLRKQLTALSQANQ